MSVHTYTSAVAAMTLFPTVYTLTVYGTYYLLLHAVVLALCKTAKVLMC